MAYIEITMVLRKYIMELDLRKNNTDQFNETHFPNLYKRILSNSLREKRNFNSHFISSFAALATTSSVNIFTVPS